ncbi:hypothetical protein MTO96_043956, partial [Rhipicephalus appendiculatus]
VSLVACQRRLADSAAATGAWLPSSLPEDQGALSLPRFNCAVDPRASDPFGYGPLRPCEVGAESASAVHGSIMPRCRGVWALQDVRPGATVFAALVWLALIGLVGFLVYKFVL